MTISKEVAQQLHDISGGRFSPHYISTDLAPREMVDDVVTMVLEDCQTLRRNVARQQETIQKKDEDLTGLLRQNDDLEDRIASLQHERDLFQREADRVNREIDATLERLQNAHEHHDALREVIANNYRHSFALAEAAESTTEVWGGLRTRPTVLTGPMLELRRRVNDFRQVGSALAACHPKTSPAGDVSPPAEASASPSISSISGRGICLGSETRRDITFELSDGETLIIRTQPVRS